MNQEDRIKELENEKVILGRISIEDAVKDSDVFAKKLELKIQDYLDKYGYCIFVKKFNWEMNGTVNAEIGLFKKPEKGNNS